MKKKKLYVGDICKIIEPFDIKSLCDINDYIAGKEHLRGKEEIGKYVVIRECNKNSYGVLFLSPHKKTFYPSKGKVTVFVAGCATSVTIPDCPCNERYVCGDSSAWWSRDSLEYVRRSRRHTLDALRNHREKVIKYYTIEADNIQIDNNKRQSFCDTIRNQGYEVL